jgi:hypothetical protein
MSQPFWYSQPSVLFNKDTWYVFVPTPNMSVSAALNAVVRFSVYLTALLFLTSFDPWYLLIIPLVMGITIFLNYWFPQVKKMTENFASGPVVSGYVGTEESMPTEDNPFMNAPLTDILDNPNRPPAADVTRMDVRNKVNKAFAQTSNIYMDTTDVFDLVQAQRNFHTVPEDDHEGLLKFLGKGSRSDKLLNEGYVVAKGTITELSIPSAERPPSGSTPASSL